ncbi:MAG: PEGA domain-containing protein, partial [Polyangiales bacterium]
SAPAVAAKEPEPAPQTAPKPEAAAAPPQAAKPVIRKLQVVSRPTGAFVTVDGKGVGRTPLEIEYQTGTELSLFAKARGYLGRRQQITVEPEQATVELVLAPLSYVVQVTSNPAGARASAVGGGEIITPGELHFKSMPASRQIVVSMDGYKTSTMSITRAEFVEETRRMSATINVILQKEGAAKPAPDAKTVTNAPAEVTSPAEATRAAEVTPPAVAKAQEAKAQEPVEPAAPRAPREVKAESEPTVAPKPVEAAPAPSGPSAVDEP